MSALEGQLDAVIESALRRDWSGLREFLDAVREALAAQPGFAARELVQRHLDTLSAAAPRHDQEGCLAELQALAAALRGSGLQPARGRAPALELRGLQPPEPIVRIFAALERSPDKPLRAILPHEPVPLYALLRERGYRCSGAQRADGGYELLIERA